MSDEHEYTTKVHFDDEEQDGYMKHFVPVPNHVAEAIDGAGVKRLAGFLNGYPFRRVLHDQRGGGRCLKFGKGWLREAGLSTGAEVFVMLGPDPNPDAVDLPEEFEEALAAAPDVAAIWAGLTPGKRRTLAYGIARAKRPETRVRRVEALLTKLREGSI